MDNLSLEQLVTLSRLSSYDFSSVIIDEDGRELSSITNNVISYDEKLKPEMSEFNGLVVDGWKIIKYTHNAATGFQAAAFEGPDGQVVISFYGTNLTQDQWADFFDDARIAFSNNTFGGPNQFQDTALFIRSIVSILKGTPEEDLTLEDVKDYFNERSSDSDTLNDIVFTGHSLGGGLCQYASYLTDGNAVTFNAVGVAQCIPDVDPSEFQNKIIDYANQFDIIGNFGIQLGTQLVVQDADFMQLTDASKDIVIKILQLQALSYFGVIGVAAALTQINQLINLLPASYLENVEFMEKLVKGVGVFSSHGLGTIMQPDSNAPGGYSLTPTTSVNFAAPVANTIYTYTSITGFAVDASVTIGKLYVQFLEWEKEAAIAGGKLIINNVEWTLSHLQEVASALWVFDRTGFTRSIGLIKSLYDAARATMPLRIDPLVLDLDGDGLETISVTNSNAHFDLDSNGFAEKTAWVSSDDGLLVYDRNGDGIINNGNELFGDRTTLSDGSLAPSGFAALAEFDSNHDGKINASDSIYASLQVWRDLDGDGITDAGELTSLANSGISSISLSSSQVNTGDGNGNVQARSGSYQDGSNTTHQIGEFLFTRDQSISLETAPTDIPTDIAALPSVQGAGNVLSLYTAMMADATGTLQGLVEDFVAAETAEERETILQSILFKWTDSDTIDPTSRGSNIDAQRLGVVEAFFGNKFVGQNGSATPTADAAALLNRAYDMIKDQIYVELVSETVLAPIIDTLNLQYDDTLGKYTADLSSAITYIDNLFATSQTTGALSVLHDITNLLTTDNMVSASSFEDFRSHYTATPKALETIDTAVFGAFVGDSGNNSIYGTGVVATVAGLGGNDTIYGSSGATDDKLYGGAGDDTLSGGAGNDLLDGGEGNDTLLGGLGNDTYLFSRGSGVDTIKDTDTTVGNLDTILLMKDITPADIVAKRYGYNLELGINGTTDKLVLSDYFSTTAYYYMDTIWHSYDVGEMGNKIEQVKFADGTVWTFSDIRAMESVRTREGTSGNDVITGYNDLDNIIYGGEGNDNITGANGTDPRADRLYGGAGNDALYGGSGADLLDGGIGNDTLDGSMGNDTYIFALGYGQDTISDTDTTTGNIDKILFQDGISPANVIATRSGYDLVLSVAGTSDKLTVSNYFSTTQSYWDMGLMHSRDVGEMGNKVEEIVFADGTTWDVATVSEKAQTIIGTDSADNISGFQDQDNTIYGLAGNDVLLGTQKNDKLYGGEGDDILTGNSGVDLLDGGVGNDTLNGSTGNDTYIFNRGYGIDTITDLDETVGNIDKILLGPDISTDDITLTRNNYDLQLTINGTNDKLVVSNYFSTTTSYWSMGLMQSRDVGEMGNKVEQIIFADGTIWAVDEIKDRARHVNGTSGADNIQGLDSLNDVINGLEGNDVIYGNNGSDVLLGDAGDDVLYGGTGNDTLDGGAGTDILIGDTGNDTYIFGVGYGTDSITDWDSTVGNIDTVSFAAGIAPSSVTVKRNSNNLEVTVGASDKLVIQNFFSSDAYKIEQFTFDDDTTWSVADIKEKVRYLTGTSGADSISGYIDQENVIDGGAGNDLLYGVARSDTYIFGIGYGTDTIKENDSTAGNIDKVAFSSSITPADVTVKRNGGNLELSINGTSDKLIVQSFFSGDAYQVERFQFADGTVWNVADVKDKARVIIGTSSSETINGYTDQDNIIYGLDGNDTIYGVYNSSASTNDRLYGENGDDTIYGYNGNDLLDGGAGNDTLTGGAGNDTYIFALGYGTDNINDSDSTAGNMDVVQFGPGITPANVTAKRNNSYLEISVNGTSDKLLIQNFFSSDQYKIEQFQFANGTTWSVADVKEKARTMIGTAVGETLTGYTDQNNIIYGLGGNDLINAVNGYNTPTDDQLYGGDGDDTIYGYYGNDLLDGGIGNDTLIGGVGNDTYTFALGYGTDNINDSDSTAGNIDTVQFGSGIVPGDVTVKRNGSELQLLVNGTSDKLIVQNFFSSSSQYQVERFQFADGTTWGVADVKEKARVMTGTSAGETLIGYTDQDNIIYGLDGNDTILGVNGYNTPTNDQLFGGAGNDTIYGYYGNDILDGGIGNDTLYGGIGNDTYIFGVGSGADTISESDSTTGNSDMALISVDKMGIIFARSGNNLNMSLSGTGDVLSVQSWYSGSAYQVEQIKASDGSTLSNTNVDQLIQAMATFSQNNGGMSWGQAITDRPQDVQTILSQYWTAPTV